MKWLQVLHDIGIDVAMMIAGLSGGLVSLRKDDDLSHWQKLLTVASGGMISTYLTPIFLSLFVKMFGDSIKVQYGLAFIIGYMGLKSIEFIISKFSKNNSKIENDGYDH